MYTMKSDYDKPAGLTLSLQLAAFHSVELPGIALPLPLPLLSNSQVIGQKYP